MLSANASKFGRLVLRRRSRLPREIQIEVTNRCNLSCRICPRERWGMPLVDMEFGVYERVLDRLGRNLCVLTLTGWGEPLMHPRFFEMARLARRRFPRARLRFTTNGTFLDGAKRSEVVASGIDQVNLSVDVSPATGALSELAHPENRRVLENFARLASLRAGADRPLELYLQAVVVSRSEEKLEALIRYAAQTGLNGLHLARLQSMGVAPLRRPSFEEERDILALACRLGRRHGVNVWSAIDHPLAMKLAGAFDTLCLRTDDYLYVDVNGQATPCCTLWHAKMGDLLTEDLASIWRSEKWERFFSQQQEICGTCDALKHRPLPTRNSSASGGELGTRNLESVS